MFDKLRPRSVYDVMAAIACFGVLAGGSAYAAATITGADVVDESLTGADVRGKSGTSSAPSVNGTLTTQDIAGQPAHAGSGTPFIDGTLTTWDIKNGTVTGADVVESSLGKVADADKLDGVDSSQFQRSGFLRAGYAEQVTKVTGEETIISWPELGARIETNDDSETDTVRLVNTRESGKINYSFSNGADSGGLGGVGNSRVIENPRLPFLVWSGAGGTLRTWFVHCGLQFEINRASPIICQGIGNRPN